MPTKRGNLSAVVFNNNIYAVGGEHVVETGHCANTDENECLDTVEM